MAPSQGSLSISLSSDLFLAFMASIVGLCKTFHKAAFWVRCIIADILDVSDQAVELSSLNSGNFGPQHKLSRLFTRGSYSCSLNGGHFGPRRQSKHRFSSGVPTMSSLNGGHFGSQMSKTSLFTRGSYSRPASLEGRPASLNSGRSRS